MWKFIMGFFKKKRTMAVATGGGLITAASVPAFIFLSSTANIGAPMTAQFEGLVLKNYIDVVGVETWCYGETQVGRLEEGYTQDYCYALFKTSFSNYAAKLYDCYNDKAKRYVTPAMHATFTDVFYNTGARCNTGMVRNLKMGKPVEACNYILKYRRAGGKDCSVRSNNCWGVWDRRLKTLPMCLEDAKKLPPEGIGEQ